MKNSIVLLTLILFAIKLNCQDREPAPWKFVWGYDNTNSRIFVPDSFQQKSIVTGFQWGGSQLMNNALLNNAYAGGWYEAPNVAVNRPIQLILQASENDGGVAPGYWKAPFLNYDPSLPITISNKGTILRTAVTTDPIFGFESIDPAALFSDKRVEFQVSSSPLYRQPVLS